MKEEKEFDLWTGSTGGSNLQPVIWLVESFNTVTDRWIVQSTSKHFLEVPVLFQIVSCGFSPNGFVEQTIWHIRLAVVLNHDLNSIILEKVTALLHCILCNGLQPQLPRERGFPSLARTPVPERGRQLPGLPDLASCISSSIQHSSVSSHYDKFISDWWQKNRLQVQFEPISQHCIFSRLDDLFSLQTSQTFQTVIAVWLPRSQSEMVCSMKWFPLINCRKQEYQVIGSIFFCMPSSTFVNEHNTFVSHL